MATWALVEELFERGDPAFAATLRETHDAERLGSFAAKWFTDRRPFARKTILEYLESPLNAWRHEALVKRLYKLAEAAGDDEIVGAFLVAFDRLIRMKHLRRNDYKFESFASREAAQAAIELWASDGYVNGWVNEFRGRFRASATKTTFHPANATRTIERPAPRAKIDEQHAYFYRRRIQKKNLRLFSPATRRYLRRRSWRYFRKLGAADPARYIEAATRFLARYDDRDVGSELDFLADWSLVHALFGKSRVIERKAMGCGVAPGEQLANARFAPYFEDAWTQRPEAALKLMRSAQCRPVRKFAAWLLREKCGGWLSRRPARVLLELIDHADEEVSSLGFDALENAADVEDVPSSEWLRRLDGDDLQKLERLAALLAKRLSPARVSADKALSLAMHQSLPVARLGLHLLGSRKWSSADSVQLLLLCNAKCESLQHEIAGWLRTTLESFGPAQFDWLMDFLDSGSPSIRSFGWDWLRETPHWDDPEIWRRLFESPYDDMRRRVGERTSVVFAEAPPQSLRWLWAGILHRVYGLGRARQATLEQVVARIRKHPEELDSLLPLLKLAMRSVRGPEFRAGLAATVGLLQFRPDLQGKLQSEAPELKFV